MLCDLGEPRHRDEYWRYPVLLLVPICMSLSWIWLHKILESSAICCGWTQWSKNIHQQIVGFSNLSPLSAIGVTIASLSVHCNFFHIYPNTRWHKTSAQNENLSIASRISMHEIMIFIWVHSAMTDREIELNKSKNTRWTSSVFFIFFFSLLSNEELTCTTVSERSAVHANVPNQ